MKKSPLTYRMAFLLALGITFLMNLLFLIMHFYGRDAVIANESERANHPVFTIEIMLLHMFFNFLVAFLLYSLNFYLLKRNKIPRPRWLYIVLIITVVTAILSYCCSWLQIQIEDVGAHPERFIRGGMFRDYFIAVVVVLSSQLIYLWNKQQQTALENERLLAENMRTRFVALKNQVDPHFLFNSLNTLNSLIKIDTEKAQEYVQQLSYVFRYTLQNKEVITLQEELKFTESYCRLMQIRYGNSLHFQWNIDEKYCDYVIIPLSLQILVENAIKHNIVSNKQPLIIHIFTADDHSITVSNPIQLKKDPETGEGIGLMNLVEKYRLIWQKEIKIGHSEDVFEITIPLINLQLL